MKKPKFTYKVVKSIKNKGYPTKVKSYHDAHMDANNAEKKVYGEKAFKKTLKTDKKLSANELAGTHTRSGKIKVSAKVPKSQRQEVALHEYREWAKQAGEKCKVCGLAKGNKVHK